MMAQLQCKEDPSMVFTLRPHNGNLLIEWIVDGMTPNRGYIAPSALNDFCHAWDDWTLMKQWSNGGRPIRTYSLGYPESNAKQYLSINGFRMNVDPVEVAKAVTKVMGVR